MRLVSSFRALFRNLAHKRRIERELADEISSFAELLAESKMRQGLNKAEAGRAALLELGGIEQVKERVREVRRGRFVETRLQDLRFACRTLRKAPLFSLTVALVLALGIGSTALMVTIVHSLLLRGPAFPQADRLFMLWQKIPQEDRVAFSVKEMTAWQNKPKLSNISLPLPAPALPFPGMANPSWLSVSWLPDPCLRHLRCSRRWAAHSVNQKVKPVTIMKSF